ncbi:MAG: GNAT family N-acetyltransferase [Halioglobus sp.]
MSEYNYRQGRVDELEAIVSIDDAASDLYYQAGLELDLGESHPFVEAESARWMSALNQGLVHVAVDARGKLKGFAVFALLAGERYLDQISVHPDAMRQGVGTRLLKLAINWSDSRPLWLTTYSHLAWNKPYYEKHGFVEVPETVCSAEIQSILRDQRAYLPDADKRIAMVHK